MSLLTPTAEKRIESEFYCEGFATTFDKPYVLYEYDGEKYFEVIERGAFRDADVSDVIFQYDHEGRVYARTSNKTLGIEAVNEGLFIYADLSKTSASRSVYEDIAAGLTTGMSWSWGRKISGDNVYDRATRTMYWKKIRKVYDVSAVSIPANADTEISARSWLDGVIDAEKRESLAQLELAKAKYFYFNGGQK